MEDGPDRLALELVAYIESMNTDNQALGQENAENEMRLAEMAEEMAALDERLGGATAERAALVQRLEAQWAAFGERTTEARSLADAGRAADAERVIVTALGEAHGSGLLREPAINMLGYRLLGSDHVELAIAVFKFPEVELFVIYAIMAFVLAIRPEGLFVPVKARRI